jgi:hypothetical protein
MWLESISRSPEEDDQASEFDQAGKVLGVMLPAHKYATLLLEGEEALYHPPSGVSFESAPVLRRGFAAV